MKVATTDLPGVLLFEPDLHGDDRGALAETWHAERYAAHGVPTEFVQDNVVWSLPGVLRGLHLQHPGAQGKLITALGGEVYDVAVDVRVGSPTFARWVGVALSGANRRQMWIPAGFAHGYCVPGRDGALLAYKMSAPYRPENELTLRWDDPGLGIRWPERLDPASRPRGPKTVGSREPATGPGARAWNLSAKDAAAPLLATVDRARLPSYGAYP